MDQPSFVVLTWNMAQVADASPDLGQVTRYTAPLPLGS
jgi:hypothetical protein